MPVQPDELELTTLAGELIDLQDKIAFLTERAEAIKLMIRESVPATGKYDAGPLTVIVSPNSRFDPQRAVEMLKAPEFAPLRRLVVREKVVQDVNRALLQGLADDGDAIATIVLAQSTLSYPWKVTVK